MSDDYHSKKKLNFPLIVVWMACLSLYYFKWQSLPAVNRMRSPIPTVTVFPQYSHYAHFCVWPFTSEA